MDNIIEMWKKKDIELTGYRISNSEIILQFEKIDKRLSELETRFKNHINSDSHNI